MLGNLKSAKLGILHPCQLIGEAQVAFKLTKIIVIKLQLSQGDLKLAEIIKVSLNWSHLVEKVDAKP